MATGDRTITVVRRPRRDKLSTAASVAPTETTITGVAILPRQTFEVNQGWVTVEGYDIWVLSSSSVGDPGRGYEQGDIVSSDFIRIDGVEWQVDGEPARYTKRGSFAGAKIQVKRVA